MSGIWIHDIHGLGGWILAFLQLANDFHDFHLIQELHAYLTKIQSMTPQVADKIDDVKDKAILGQDPEECRTASRFVEARFHRPCIHPQPTSRSYSPSRN